MVFKLIIAFDKLSQASFLLKAQAIKTALTSEPALTLLADPWPAPYPSRATLTTAYTEYETALDASADGGKTARDDRDQKRARLTTVLKDLAPYFESVAKAADDVTILDATGYERWQSRDPIPQPPAAPELKLPGHAQRVAHCPRQP